MPNRILALDPHGAQLTAVVVETSFRSYQIVGHFAEHRNVTIPLADQLRTFVARHPMTADTVLSAIPGNAASFRVFDLPFRDRRRLAQTVPYELEGQVPFAVDEAIVDFQVLGRNGEGTRVFAALVPRGRIEEHLKLLSDAGLDPAIIDFSPLTTLNVLQLFDGQRPDRYGFLHLSAGRGTLALYTGGELRGLRVIEVAEEPLAPALVREIGWSLKTFAGAAADGEALPPLLVAGSDAALVETLGQEMGVQTQRLEDLPLRRVPATLHGRQGTFASTLGLALREIADEPTLGLNFRREAFSYRRAQEEFQGVAVRLGSLAAIVVVLFVIWQALSYYQLSTEYEQVRGVVRDVFRSVLPNASAIDEVEQLGQEIRRLQKEQQQLGFGPNGPISMLEVLRHIAERAPTEPRLNVDELTIDADGAHLRAKTSSYEAVETIRKKLSESTAFADAQVKDPRSTPDGSVEFRLNLPFSKGEG